MSASLPAIRALGATALLTTIWVETRTSRCDWLLEQIETALRTSLRDRPVLTTFGQHNDPLPFQPRWWELFPHAQQGAIAVGNHSPMNDDPHGVAVAIWSWRQDSS